MIYYGQELYHHGIKGQRWGVRRYQNEDGSLTVAGLRRYKTKEYTDAKADYKKARKNYNKAFKKASQYTERHPVSQWFGKNKAKSNSLWTDAYNKATTLDAARDKKNIEKHIYKAKYLSERATSKALLKTQKMKVKDLDKKYGKAFQEAYRFTNRHIVSQWFGKNKVKSDALWGKAYDAATEYNSAKEEYRRIKSTS